MSSNHDHHGPVGGPISRWILTTNHKDIGTMYLWFSFIMFIVGGIFAMLIRAELFQPGMQLLRPEFFNQMTTLAWASYGIWCDYARFYRLSKLACANDGRCARYGLTTYE